MFDESLLLEQEISLLRSVELSGVPTFDEEGPANTINGDVAGLGLNPVVGAIEAIAAHPTDANKIFIGAVAGGIWMTTDGSDWTPLTDEWPSLSISALAFSPLDATSNTLFAGTGNFSSNSSNGGPAFGALRSTDGGDSWDFIGEEFLDARVRSIVPTAIGTSLADQVVLAATVDDGGGVYRSIDGGDTFEFISGTSGASDGLDNNANGTVDEAGELNLPIGNASHLVADPGNKSRFYVALPTKGIFRSDDGGATWLQVNTGLTGVEDATRIELSVSEATGNPVYAAFIEGGNKGVLKNVFRSGDHGADWTQVGTAPAIHPGQQGDRHFSILADRTSDNIVYVGGDTQKGSEPPKEGDVFVGNLFRGDSTKIATEAWTSIVLAGAAGTAPHADSRDMVFDANNNILQADDGGIYRLVNPNASGTRWESLPSMPRVAQLNSNISYDELNNVIIGGTQDTGAIAQIDGFIWRDFTKADGGYTAIDDVSLAPLGMTIYYVSAQELGVFQRITFDNNHAPIGEPTFVGLVVGGAGDKELTSSATKDGRTYKFDSTIQFLQPYVLNNIDPKRMLIGTSFLYESMDRGDTLTPLGGLNDLTSDGLDNDLDGTVDNKSEYTAAGPIGRVTKMVYGGRAGGVDNPDLIYVASAVGENEQPILRLRTAANTPVSDFRTLSAPSGSLIADMDIDPDDWSRGYVLDVQGRVFRFENSGAEAKDWNDITGNLRSLIDDVRAIELFTPTSAAGDDVVLVSGFGGVYRTLNPGPSAVWTAFGGNLPNVVATDVVYNEADDVLIVGTYGRGAWTLGNASTVLTLPSGLRITGDADFAGQDDIIKLVRNADNPRLLDVFLNSSVPTRTVELSTLQQINVDGLGGNDTLIVETSTGLINVPL